MPPYRKPLSPGGRPVRFSLRDSEARVASHGVANVRYGLKGGQDRVSSSPVPVAVTTAQDSPASSPWEVIRRDPKGSARQALAEFKRDRAAMAGAGLAFYWFLAIFPTLIAAVGILDLLSLGSTRETIRRLINLALPPSAASELTGALSGNGDEASASIVAIGIGLAVALWGASTGMAALQEGFDIAYDITKLRTFSQKRLRAFKMMAIAGVFGVIGLVVLAFGQALGETIQNELLRDWGGFTVLWDILRMAVVGACIVAVVATLYRLAPNREPPPLKWLAPGGAIAVAIVVVTSFGFSFYVKTFGSYASTYGSLAGVVVLVLWLYLTGLALLLGAEVNALLERKSQSSDGPGSAGGAP